MDGGRTHRTSRRDILAGSLGLGLAGALGPLAGRPALAQTPKRGGTLRVALPPAPNLDPLKMEAAGAIAIVQQVAEYLVWVEPDLSLRPVLATSWVSGVMVAPAITAFIVVRRRRCASSLKRRRSKSAASNVRTTRQARAMSSTMPIRRTCDSYD